MKRVTPENSARSHPPALGRTILLQRLHGVSRASRIVATRRREQRANPDLIPPDYENQNPLHRSRRLLCSSIKALRTLYNCSFNSSNDRSYALRRHRIMRSRDISSGSNIRLEISRSRRFSRFRSTAECPCRGTIIPTRTYCRGEARDRTSRSNARTRLPFFEMPPNSELRVIRFDRGYSSLI